jgi:hypothetical protein
VTCEARVLTCCDDEPGKQRGGQQNRWPWQLAEMCGRMHRCLCTCKAALLQASHTTNATAQPMGRSPASVHSPRLPSHWSGSDTDTGHYVLTAHACGGAAAHNHTMPLCPSNNAALALSVCTPCAMGLRDCVRVVCVR